MTVFDYAVLLIIGLSVLLSVIRGMVREVLALAGWVIAFLVANFFAAELAPMLPAAVSGESLRLLVTFAALFVVTLLIASLVSTLASELVKSLGLGTVDRVLGALFGLARGLLIVVTVVLLAGLTSLPRQPFWREAALSRPLEAVAIGLKPWLPRELSKRIRYD